MMLCSRVRVVVFLLVVGLVLAGVPLLAQDKPKGKPDSGAVLKELEPKTVTIQEKEITVKAALAALLKQTGNRVVDRRQEKTDTRLKLNLDKVTFWQALDAIAKEADARVALFEQDGALALGDGPYQEPTAVSYQGLFRTTIKRFDATLVFDAEAHYATITLEVAWEPRFRPFFLEVKPESLALQDDKGNAVEMTEEGRGQAPVEQRNAMELRLRTPAPRRSAQKLGLLKGTLNAVGAGKMIDFTFADLAKAAKPGNKERPKLTQDGVTMTVRRFLVEDDGDKLWTVEMQLDYPGGGPRFESFQSWFIHNEIYLLKEQAGLEIRFPNNAGLETDDATETTAIIRYRFADEADKKLLLGQPADWKLVYRAPGKFVEVPVPFEFKDVRLP